MIIDLSVRLNEDTPVYPGDPKLEVKSAATFEKDTYLGHSVTLGTHAGTHIDSPAHMIEGGNTLDSFSADSFVGAARYVQVLNNEFNLDDVQSCGIQEGDIVLFHTGMSDHNDEQIYFENYPAMSEEIARYLVACKVKMVGVDTCSIDNDPKFPIHKLLLSNNILIIENLTNLGQLSGIESVIYALPIKLDLDGAPARVIAEVKNSL